MAKLPPSTMRTRFEPSKSNFWPPFFHVTVGSGMPRGGAHSSSAVSPCAMRVFCGSRRNSSRSTAKGRREESRVMRQVSVWVCGLVALPMCVCVYVCVMPSVHLIPPAVVGGYKLSWFCMINACPCPALTWGCVGPHPPVCVCV